MKHLQNRLLFMVVWGIIFVTVIIGGIFFYGYGSMERKRSRENVSLKISGDVNSINDTMLKAEKFTRAIAEYYQKSLPANMQYKGEAFNQYVDNSRSVARSIAEHNEMIGAIYYRFNIERAGSKAGFFLSKNKETGQFEEFECTDIVKYDSSDRERVSWYYEPIEAGKAIWLKPYYNKNNAMQSISYIIPLYDEEKVFIGVVGIDIDYQLLCDRIASMNYFDNDYTVLCESDGRILYAPEEIELSEDNRKMIMKEEAGEFYQYREGNVDYMALNYPLQNENCLVYSVPVDEFSAAERQIELSILLAVLFLITILVGILTGLIYRTFQHAQRDALTSAFNRDAYLAEILETERNYLNKRKWKGLCIVVFDVNGLKKINDAFGHIAGDEMIVESYNLIHRFFPEQAIYRIGGDEFVILGNKFDTIDMKHTLETFTAIMDQRAEQYENNEKIVIISAGMAYFDEKRHNCYEDVFAEADRRMYENKKRFYENFQQEG